MNRPREIPYRDDLLADGSVHRRYGDGREEWRRRDTGPVVRWHDNQGASGTDEPLGQRIVKRRYADGTVVYGRDIGYGRTVWGRGETVLVNRTTFGGRVGAVLAGLGLVTLGALTAAQLPPVGLTPEEEEELRSQAAAQTSSGGIGGSTDSGDWDGDWGDNDGGWSDDDFG
ncbi:hypothetical protein [Streptomyces sp. NPDC088725]|uniref:hypothetical protein n=1 Tax=Streptomyces sp. NPDC088725 TaxID=3365873 RepID=UPI00380D2266